MKQFINNNLKKTAKDQTFSDSTTDFAIPLPQEIIFANGQSHFEALIQDINAAKYHIDLETYIYHKDHLGKLIAESLIDAAKRGVKIRVLVDGAGTPFWSGTFARQLESVGAETQVFHPFPWQLWHWSRSVIKANLLLRWIYLLLKINSRNHRKVCLIDGKIAHIGSCNISKCHLPKAAGGQDWRDTAVRLSDIDLSELQNAFDCAWHYRTFKERLREAFRHIRRNPIFRLNHTRHRRRLLYKNLLRHIAAAKHRIWITNAYFVPDNFLLKKFKDAARRGVDVRILLPKNSDIIMMPWASSTFYYTLLKEGVRIFEYLPGILHAKSLIIDDWMLIGSSNLNHRSLLHDLEVDVNITSPESKQFLEQLFLDDLTHSKEVSLNSWNTLRPRFHRWLGRLVLYIKYWI